jgi:xanthine dehydrogenase FAD-binding subunit
LSDFILGPGKTALADGELVTGFECDGLAGFGGSFEKVGHRRSLVISIVCLAVLVKLDRDGSTIDDARLAIAGIRPVPRRLREIEDLLRGKPLSGALLEQAADMPLDLVQSRTRQDYRRDVVRGFLVRGLIAAAKRAGAAPDALTDELEAAYG